MDVDDLYFDREDLMTPEEIEDMNHDPSTETIPTFTPNMRAWLVDSAFTELAAPEAATRRQFERRPPALGATEELLMETRMHNRLLPAVQQRKLFSILRSRLFRFLIPCPGASTTDELLDILRKELDSGIPAPVPKWYKFSTVTMGPRKIGYDACANRDCFQTETVDNPFSRCAKCKLPNYCSRECQMTDWKVRHKYVCKDAIEKSEQMKRVGKMLQNLSDLSMTGQDFGGDIAAAMHSARKNPAVKDRRAKLRAEKKRPIGEKPKGPDPEFF